MNTNDQLGVLQAFIGKEFTASPSPFMRWLRPVVLAAERGKLSFQYEIREEMINPIGTLHGGVTAALMDDIIGATMYSFNETYFYTTVNNLIDYFAPARAGEIVIAETTVLKKGSRIVNAQCEIWNETRVRMIARGYSNLLRTDIKKQSVAE